MAAAKPRGATTLSRWLFGRPERWKRDNLIQRGKALAEYCQAIIDARYGELGVARDTQHRMQKRIRELEAKLEELSGQEE